MCRMVQSTVRMFRGLRQGPRRWNPPGRVDWSILPSILYDFTIWMLMGCLHPDPAIFPISVVSPLHPPSFALRGAQTRITYRPNVCVELLYDRWYAVGRPLSHLASWHIIIVFYTAHHRISVFARLH